MQTGDDDSDPLQDYLANSELLAELSGKRAIIIAQAADLQARGHNPSALLASLDKHCEVLRQLVAHQEKLIEEFLQHSARNADASRELFLAVADLIKAVQKLTPEEWAMVPAQSKADWQQLVREFSAIRADWASQLTAEDRARLEGE